jgi:anti-sigma factor RsiW
MTDDDDASLIALIDGKLEGPARDVLSARLEADPDLRSRFERLAAGGLPFGAAFKAVLDEAPVARMQTRLDEIAAVDQIAASTRPTWTGAVAAGLALLVIGWAVGRYAPLGPGGGKDDWREAVASYVALYSADTFAAAPGGPEAALGVLSGRLGLSLNPGSIALPDMQFKRAFMLSYEGAPLGQIAYVDAAGRPAAFCIIHNGQKDAPVTTDSREGLSLASWAREGRGYVLAGHFSAEQAAALANTLAARF